MARRRRNSEGPQPLANSLAAVFAGVRRVDLVGISAVVAAWDEVVGEPLASHTAPAKLMGGTLTVLVDRPVWGSQIKLMGVEICSKITSATGVPITGLEVTISQG